VRWLPSSIGVIIVTIVSTSWHDVIYVVARGAGDSQTPSAFATWSLVWTGWAVGALGVLAIATAATSRRDALVSIALALAAGTLWLVYWQLNPPQGTLTGPPTFGAPAWVCAVAMAAAAIATAWKAWRPTMTRRVATSSTPRTTA
jgi:hypothetical protein